MIPRPFDDISFRDIEALIDSRVRESKTIEYKVELPHEGDSKKIPFLAEVSAFANTVGGDMIFGLEEKEGVPVSIKGLDVQDLDAELLRLNSAILNGIEPRVPQLAIKGLKATDGRQVLVLRIGKSWAAPHRVSYKDHSKFYGRNSAGKYPLDVTELRAAFTLSELLSDRIRYFRESRVTALLVNRELPVAIAEGGKLAIHIIPLTAFSGPDRNPIAPTSEHTTLFPPLGAGGWNHRINLDGLITYDSVNQEARAYAQVFRSGAVEAVIVLKECEGRRLLPCEWYEKEIVNTTQRYLLGLKKFGMNGPIYFFLTLVGMKGFSLGVGPSFFDHGETIDRDLVLVPEVMIELQAADLPALLKPAFDTVWNAFGYERSFNYDNAGNWKHRRGP